MRYVVEIVDETTNIATLLNFSPNLDIEYYIEDEDPSDDEVITYAADNYLAAVDKYITTEYLAGNVRDLNRMVSILRNLNIVIADAVVSPSRSSKHVRIRRTN